MAAINTTIGTTIPYVEFSEHGENLPVSVPAGPGTVEDKYRTSHVEHQPRGDFAAAVLVDEPAYMSYSLKQTARAFWRAVTFSMMVAVGAMYDAYVVSVPQNLLANDGFIDTMATEVVDGVLTIDPIHITLWGVMYTLGSIFTMVNSPWISDKFGRKTILYLMTLCLIGDAIIGIFAKNWRVFMVARWCSGMAAGFLQTGINSYISEIAPTKIRGALLVQYAIMFGAGGLLGTVTLNEIANYAPLDYKIAFYTEFGVLAIFLPGVLFAPESPIWYARRGQEAKAKRSMRKLYSTEPSYDIDTEYDKILILIEEERNERTEGSSIKQYLECFRGTNLRRTMIAFLPLVMQQMSGLVVFLGYCAYFFALAGYAKPFQASVIIQSILLAFVILSFFIIDKVGRRPLLLGGLVMMVVTNVVNASLGFLATPPGTAMIIISCLWAAAYSLSLGPLGWTYLSEVPSATLRAKTMGLATAMTAAFNLIWSYTVPLMLSPAADNWGLHTSYVYGGLCFFGFFAVYFIIPETKGRSFAELDEMFVARVSTRQFPTYKTKLQLEQGEAGFQSQGDEDPDLKTAV